LRPDTIINRGSITIENHENLSILGETFVNEASGIISVDAVSFADFNSINFSNAGTIDIAAHNVGIAAPDFDTTQVATNSGTILLSTSVVTTDGLTNTASGLIDLTGAGGFHYGFKKPDSTLANQGRVVADAGSGETRVTILVVNDGRFTAKSGTLDFVFAVSGDGAIEIDGGAGLVIGNTLASGEAVTFAGAGASLAIADAAGFAGTIAGFAASDTIDLTKFAYHKSESVVFTENGAGTSGVLTVKDGSSLLNVTLFGQYVASGFGLKTDGAAGTDLTYTPPASRSALQLATAHH
jgi:hypothetical protein